MNVTDALNFPVLYELLRVTPSRAQLLPSSDKRLIWHFGFGITLLSLAPLLPVWPPVLQPASLPIVVVAVVVHIIVVVVMSSRTDLYDDDVVVVTSSSALDIVEINHCRRRSPPLPSPTSSPQSFALSLSWHPPLH